MITIYTYNGNVVKDSTTGKWFTKPSGPGPGPSIEEVTIGTQTWMAKNLAIDDGGEGITIINNNYYYDRAAARRIAETVEGWHLPTRDEWDTLIENAGGFNGLASTNSWTYGGGTNSSGFNALPIGHITSSGTYDGEGFEAAFWSYTYKAVIIHYEGNNGFAETQLVQSKYLTQKCSVRLIKDT